MLLLKNLTFARKLKAIRHLRLTETNEAPKYLLACLCSSARQESLPLCQMSDARSLSSLRVGASSCTIGQRQAADAEADADHNGNSNSNDDDDCDQQDGDLNYTANHQSCYVIFPRGQEVLKLVAWGYTQAHRADWQALSLLALVLCVASAGCRKSGPNINKLANLNVDSADLSATSASVVSSAG